MHQLLTAANKAEHGMNKAKAFAVDVFRSVPPCRVLEQVQTSPRWSLSGAEETREQDIPNAALRPEFRVPLTPLPIPFRLACQIVEQ
jgi:hypothetical protein